MPAAAARPAAPAPPRPPAPPAARPPPPPPPSVPPPARSREVFSLEQHPDTERLLGPTADLDGDEEIPILEDEIVEAEEVRPPAPPPLRSVPPPARVEPPRPPPLSVVPPPPPADARHADGGEALLREALSKASRDVIEKIAWEVVPELAEAIIREELDRLMKERGA